MIETELSEVLYTASGQNLIKPCWTFFSKVPKIFFSHLPTHSPAAPSQPFHLQIKVFLECYLANLPKDTRHVNKCALSFKLSIVLVGNLSHGLSNKCIECNACCNVYRMSYMIVVHTTMKRQTTTKKERASLNADDLFYVAPNQCDYWETLNVRYPQEKQTYL